MTFQEKIKAKRKELNLTQLELAERLGYKTAALVSKAENGTRVLKDEEIAAYAEALGTTAEELRGDDAEEMTEQEPVAVPVSETPQEAQTYTAKTIIKRPPSALAVLAFVMALIVLLGSGVSFFFGYKELTKLKRSGRTAVIEQSDTPVHDYASNPDGTLDTAALINKTLPSVVYIEFRSSTKGGSGSGVIFTAGGWILTCAHVISGAEEASQITVCTNDGQEHTATEFYFDSSSDTGIVKIEGTFTPADIGDSSKLVAGDRVVAIGTPIDKTLFQTATDGIVSSIRENYDFTSLGLILNVIQHSAPINEGNSGGPLFNAYGQLIGINTIRMAGSYDGVAFALLSNDVLRYAQDLITYGKVNRPMIGITGSSSMTSLGITVEALTEGGCAAEAGIQVGDMITHVDGIRIRAISQLISYLTQNTDAGDTVTLTVERGNETLEFSVLLKASIELDY